ncbi:glycosyltransferase [Synechocystis sp. PCC 7339]|uniref:glycosyltransferase n=1 Tax=unclassified Synechocystis TaxID=2640012 RepID=UPI001BB0385A|nr:MULTISPECIES: glycosyltransferase [unclassified Synechocystis]QUS59977.1 glycosyltransferase [Synechocystis sp. PCC 7338]UAJ72571.1 glycosyltransferase [Synechocystis sp. PCC 7339]
MKIIHISRSFSYEVTGGTEIFVDSLAQAQSLSHDVLWVVHTINKEIPKNFTGFRNCYPLKPISAEGRLNKITTHVDNLDEFKQLLLSYQPDILHLHSLCDSCGLSHINISKSLGITVVVTIHAPGFTCMQGSLIYHKKEICDGVITEGRCTECRLVNGRLPYPIALLASAYDWPWLSTEAKGKVAHILTARQITAAFHRTWQEMVEKVDIFHVLCDWSREVLVRNGVADSKLHLIRTAGPTSLPPKQRQPMEDGILKCVFWGRFAAVKGLHLIIRAVQSLPKQIPIEISFYGPYQDDDYGQRIQKMIKGDGRFKLCGNFPKDELLPKLQNYDLALIPSTWLETGPLTVLEAFAAGLPVAGSDLGGIKELLTDKAGGYLLPIDWKAWASFFRNIIEQRLSLTPLSIEFRSFSKIANEIDVIYKMNKT